MSASIILSLAYFVTHWAWVGTANRVFPLNVAPHARVSFGIATDETDEAGCRLHHQALVDQFFWK